MNHNTNIHFGNRTLIPHDLHGRSYQDPAASCHIRSLPTALIRRLKDLAETSIITIIIKTDLRFIINHLDQCCIHTTTMFSIGGEIAISMPCLRVSWRAKEKLAATLNKARVHAIRTRWKTWRTLYPNRESRVKMLGHGGRFEEARRGH
ncbi:unnamed protein product [Microthlaspi erraticum]|uniref:Uncharacterized protein n=1 Tax=Microthlaspi erraticum TaxID=1685480 RepID=A0A6D2IY67_9BRAS|nr:unnamed protein product [Microthlaspi erraticum]